MDKMKKIFNSIRNKKKQRKSYRKILMALYLLLCSFSMFALSGLTDSYAATQYKTKTFYIYGLSDSSNVQIKAIRDSDGYSVWGWGSTGAGGNINVYNLGGGTWQISMVSANVTNWTPYCYVTTSKWGYDPTGWTLGEAGPHGTSGYNGSEVHHEGDFYFSNNSCSFYIGAGFCRNSLTANWTPWQHNVSYNTNGGKLNDDIENPNDYVMVDNGEYFIRSCVGSNMFMHASGTNNYGPNVVIWSSYSYSADQTVWIVERYKDTPYYYIYNKRSSKALNLQGDGAGVLDTLELYSVRSADDDGTYGDFLWYFVDEGNGNVSIRNKKTNKAIDVTNASSANGTSVNTYQYNGSVAQKWTLYQASQNDYPTKKKESGLDHYINSATPVREGYEFLYWCGENTTTQMTTIQNVNQSCIKRYRLAKVNGYDRWELLVYAENCSRIQAPMWTEKNGQDDLVWHELGSGSWERDGQYFNFGTQITIHNSEVSGYFLHLYARDGSGNTLDQYNTTNQIGKIGAIYRPGEHYTLDSKDSITLYAIWNPNNYTVHFDGNGASEGSMEDQAFVYDVEQELYSNEFSKDGYVFDGWNTESDGSGTHYDDAETVKNLTSEDEATVTLYAQWKPYSYNVIFDGNGSTGGSMSSQEFEFNETKALNANSYSKTGYVFDSWNTDPNGKGTKYSNKQEVTNLVNVNGGSITLYAQWTPIDYKVRFNGNGSTSGTMSDQSFTYDVSKKLTNNSFMKTGYVFDGWNTESDGSGNSYSNGESVINLSSKDGDIVVLYAQWTPIHFYIRFNGNGNTGGTMSDQMFTYGQPDTLNINRFTKSGYTFMGWDTEPDGNGYRYVDGQTIMNLSSTDGTTIDLYAQWSKNNYSVIFNGNGSTSGSMSNQKFEFDVAQQLNANAYKKTGYVFSSWNTKSDGTGTKYTDRQQVKNLVSVNGGSITLYAQWSPVSYSVKFNGNGNTSGSMSNQVFEYDKAQNLKSNTFSRTGYIFSGWNTKSDGSGTDYSNGQSVKNLSATNGAIVNLYAKWTPISYTVSFEGNGATSGSMIAQSFKYDELKALTANAFKKTGYTFTGWNTSKDGSGDPFTNGQVVRNLTSTANGNVTLYAQWAPVSYTVVFNGNGNTGGTMASQVFKYDETKALTSNTFTKTGYLFTGWNTAKDGSGSTYGDREQIKNLTSTAGATVTLYAQWTPISYTVTFNGNGHTGGSMNSQSFRYDETKALSPNNFTKTGYTFTGWNTQTDGRGTAYTNAQQVKNLTAVNGATITLYAQWETNTYTVNFIGNGATGGTMNSQVFAYNETKPLSTNAFVKTGYMFTSWNTKANGTGTKYTDKQQVSNLTSADGGVVNLYAQWTPVSYTVIFNGNGHTGGSMANQSFKYDESKALTVNSFTKTGYLFNGWNTKADGSGTKYTNGQTVSNLVSTNGGTITLYAQWTPISYTVKFEGNGSTSGSMMNQSFEYDESKALTANAYKKTGYTFIGWNTSKDGSGKPYTNGQVVSNLTDVNNGTVTLYAQWSANDYIVKFDGNGSTSGTMSNQSFRYDEAQKLSANMYKKTGYIFTGWNTMKNGSGVPYADMQSVENLTSADGGKVTLYAQWTPISYTVVFNGNGSTNGTMSNQIFDYDESKPLTKNAFTRAGYKFSGWSTNKDGSGQTYSDAQVVSNLTAVDGGIVNLYAQWQPTTYTVVFDGNGNTGGSMSDITLKFDIEQSLPENSYVKKGYTFTGWNTKADGSGKKYSDGQSVTNLVSYDESSITLYAQWTANDYIVKFDGNGSTGGNMSDQSFKYDQEKALNPNEFIRTGYTFNGWNTKADGSGIKFADKETVMNLTDAANGVVTLYAQWTANSYTVVFDGNGSTSGSMNNQSFKYDEEKSLSKNQYSKTGYQFTGWNTKADGTGENYKDQEQVMNLTSVNNGTVTLYAQWSANSYIVVFDGNGNTSGSMENQLFRYDQSQKLFKNQYLRTGYTFTGWNTMIDGSGQNFKDGESVKNLTTENNGIVTLYAQWSENSYTVRYHGNGNTGGSMKEQTFKYTELKKLFKNEYTNTGYRFTEWNTVKDGSGDSYADEQTVSKLADKDNAIVDLYAQWVLNINATITVQDEYYHVGDDVSTSDLRESLEAVITDLTSNSNITDIFDEDIIDKVITKQIVNEANEVQDISEKLDTSSKGYYYATYILIITDKYNPDNQVAVQVEQKIVITEDVKDSEQQVPQVVPDGSGVSSEIQPIRYISKKYINTLSENSKWVTNSVLNQELMDSLNKEATDENAIYIIEMTKEECQEIKEYICDGKVWDKDLNKEVLDVFGADIITKQP